jgi:hypothetical protein
MANYLFSVLIGDVLTAAVGAKPPLARSVLADAMTRLAEIAVC